MIAHIDVNGSVIKVPVGEGRQSFKWLAQVIQSRISKTQSLRSTFGPDNVVVIGLKNFANQLINPVDCLYEHQSTADDSSDVKNGTLAFTAEVVPQFESDKWGNPMYNDWFHAAYIVSDSAKKWSSDMRHWRENETERLRQKKESAEGDDDYSDDENYQGSGADWNNDLAAGSSLIHIGEDQFSLNDVRTSFSLDWGNMKFSWMNNLNISIKITIHDLLRAHYGVICHLFLHYCGVGKVGQRFGMTLREFDHLLTFATKGHKRECSRLAEGIYNKVMGTTAASRRGSTARGPNRLLSSARGDNTNRGDHTNRGDNTNSGDSTNRGDRTSDSMSLGSVGSSGLAGSDYISSPPGSASGHHGNNHGATTNHVAAEISDWPLLSRSAFAECLMCYAVDAEVGTTIPDAIEGFLTGQLSRLLGVFRESFLKYTQYESNTVQVSYYLLRQTFLQKATIHRTHGPAVTLEHFLKIATSASLLTEADGNIEKERMLCETAFASALLTIRPSQHAQQNNNSNQVIQKKRVKPASEGETKGEDDDARKPPTADLGDGVLGFEDELVFSEFVEALAKLALITMTTAKDLSNARKIRLCYSFIVEQDPESLEEFGSTVPPLSADVTAYREGFREGPESAFRGKGEVTFAHK